MCAEYAPYGDGKFRTTPMPSGTFITRVPEKSVPEEVWRHMQKEAAVVTARGYRGLVGSLLWLARCTMPDILVAVSMMAKVMCMPTEKAWELGIYCVEYCRGQRSRGIRFKRGGNRELICYYDASNRADVTTGKAQHGHALFLADGPVINVSSIQKHVGMSASHNEFMALRWAAMNVVWMRELLVEMKLGWMVPRATPCNGDNKTAVRLSYEEMITPGNKYYMQEYWYVKEKVQQRLISPRWVGTKQNYSDPLTKVQTKGGLEETRPGLTGYLEHGLPTPPRPPPDVDTWR